jgi:hypothetical protein
VSHVGLGYFILKTNYNQKVHGEGIYRRNNFASFIGESNLEAEVITHLFENKLVKKVQNVWSDIINSRIRGVDLKSSCCNDILIEAGMFKRFQERFEKIRILIWMKFIAFEVVMMTGAK